MMRVGVRHLLQPVVRHVCTIATNPRSAPPPNTLNLYTYLQGVDHVAQALAHLAALVIPHQTMQVDGPERRLRPTVWDGESARVAGGGWSQAERTVSFTAWFTVYYLLPSV